MLERYIRVKSEKDKEWLFVLEFLLKLIILVIPIYAISYFHLKIASLQVFTAWTTAKTLGFIGVPLNYSGITLVFNKYVAEIVWDCTGWKSIWAFTALCIAYPSSIRKKIFSLLFLPIIVLSNIIRLTTTFFVGYKYGLNLFSITHNFLWQEGLILVVISLWLLWMRTDFDSSIKKKY